MYFFFFHIVSNWSRVREWVGCVKVCGNGGNLDFHWRKVLSRQAHDEPNDLLSNRISWLLLSESCSRNIFFTSYFIVKVGSNRHQTTAAVPMAAIYDSQAPSDWSASTDGALMRNFNRLSGDLCGKYHNDDVFSMRTAVLPCPLHLTYFPY